MKATFIALLSMCLTACKGSTPIKCRQGNGADAAVAVCAGDKATATKCSQPRFVEYSGVSEGVPYACGPCPANSGHTCEECIGSAGSACNEPKPTGTDFKCYDYELKNGTFVMKETPTTCKRLKTTSTIKCNMPGDFADEKYVMKKKGCGGCPYQDKAARRCAECEGREQCNKTPIKCIQGDGSDLSAKICVPGKSESPPVKCHQPKFIEYTGFTDQKYGCGPCADSSSSSKCQSCTGNTDTACNTKIENIGRDFYCPTYEYKDEKFVMKQEKVACKRLAATLEMKCRKPGAKTDKASTKFKDHQVCGGCTEDDKKAPETCQDSVPAPISCVVGDAKSALNKTCDNTLGQTVIEKCHQTKFVQYFGLAGELKYGCGPCPSDSKTTCQECYGSGNTNKSCNKVIETNTDYTCYDYEYKDDKFKAKKTMMTCKRLKDTAPKCNMPGKNATQANYNKKGCGGCTEEEMKASTCTECGNVECNKAYVVTFTAVVLPLILAFL